MNQKSDNFSMEQAARLASTQEGQQLVGLLRNQQGANLDIAIAKANQGDYSALQKSVQQLLASPEAKKLMEKLGG